MKLTKLKLTNFRNYEDFCLDFHSNKTLIVGKNAKGKTNILEAIGFMSSLTSSRISSLNELIMWGKEFSNIKLWFEKDNFETKLECVISLKKNKILKINDVKKNKSVDFLSQLKAISFTVDDLLLLRGTPEDRRNWLDLAIGQIYPAYMSKLSKYNKIKTQKNNFLKTSKTNNFLDMNLLDVYNSQLVVAGSNILFLRLKFLNEIVEFSKKNHNCISQDEILSFSYQSNILGEIAFEVQEALISIDEIAKKYEEKLDEIKSVEILRSQMLVGPHRDDLGFFINKNDAKKFSSQGQQRTIVLALKLAQMQLVKEKCNENPLLLLDDVLAELDDLRQNFLLESLNDNTHTIITSVDALQFDKKYLENVEIFKI